MTAKGTDGNRQLSSIGLCLAILHLAVCGAVAVGESTSRGEWSPWFYVFLLDFPASIVALVLPLIPGGVSFALVGTIWWYFLGHSVTTLLSRRSGGSDPQAVANARATASQADGEKPPE